MTTTEQVLQALRAGLTTAGATRVRVGQTDAVRDAAESVSVVLVTDVPIGFPQRVSTTSITARRESRWMCTGYGENQFAVLQAFADRAFVVDDPIAVALVAAGACPIRTIGPRDTTAFYRTGMLPQSTLEVVVGYSVTHTNTTSGSDATEIDVDINAGELVVAVPEP